MSLLSTLSALAQVPTPSAPPTPLRDPEILITPLQRACGTESPSPICTWLYEQTNNGAFAKLAGEWVPTVIKVVVIVAIAAILSRLAKRVIVRLVTRAASEGADALTALRRRAPAGDDGAEEAARSAARQRLALRTQTIAAVLSSVMAFVIWAIAVIMILGLFRVNIGPLIAGAGIVGVALGFGSQSLVKDFLSGTFMLLEDQFGVGDIVDVGEAAGVVEHITLRVTRLRDVEGTVWHVPNGEIRRIGNKSQLWSRSLIDVGVAYSTDIAHAKTVIKEVADSVWRDPVLGEHVLEEPEVWGVENFGPNEIVIRLVLKVRPAKQWALNREIRARMKAAFDDEGIEIPFPQRTVWMHQMGHDPEHVNGQPTAGAGATGAGAAGAGATGAGADATGAGAAGAGAAGAGATGAASAGGATVSDPRAPSAQDPTQREGRADRDVSGATADVAEQDFPDTADSRVNAGETKQ